jgi:hypothetical protein
MRRGWLVSRRVLDGRLSATAAITDSDALTLHIDTPFLLAQTKGLERSLLTKTLCLVNVFVATVVSCAWVSFRVFVCADL